MPRPHVQNDELAPTILPGREHTSYVVVRREDVWFIQFNGQEYGPYKTEREALLFAIDAAHKLGEKGAETQVLGVDEAGKTRPAWTYGRDSYPPKQQ